MDLSALKLSEHLRRLDPWLDAAFPISTFLICTQQRVAGYSVLSLFLLLKLLQKADTEAWRWILISLLVVNAGLIIRDRDLNPVGGSDYLIIALSFAAGLERPQIRWKASLGWMAACIIPLLLLSLIAGKDFLQANTSFTGFNINRIGFLTGLTTIYSYGLLKQERKTFGRTAAGLLLSASIYTSILTQSRAAIAVPAITILLDNLSSLRWSKKRLVASAALAIAIATFTAFEWYGNPKLTNKAADINRIETLRCWLITSTDSSNRFIFGFGYGKHAQKHCGPKQVPGLIATDASLAHSHNLYVQILSESGALGLTLGIGLTLAAFRKSQKIMNEQPGSFCPSAFTYVLLMSLGSTWHAKLMLNQVLVGYSLAALTAISSSDAKPSKT